MATGSNRFLQYTKQTAPRELPDPAIFHRLRNTGGSGLINNRTNITSDEIRADRQIIESRLGQNQPDLSVPFELSFDSFDDLIQGAMGGSWIGGRVFTFNGSVNTEGAFTLTSGEWEDHPVREGDYVVIESEDNTAVGYVSSIDEGTLSVMEASGLTALTTVAQTEDDIRFTTGHYATVIDASSTTITVVADTATITRSLGSWTSLGVEVGDKVFFDGFAENANNGWKEVEAVTTTVLTIRDGGLSDETLNSGSLLVGTSTGFITVGTGLDFFGFEEGFTDINSGEDINGDAVTDGLFHHIIGCYVSSWNLDIQPDAMLTGEFSFQGLKYSGFLKDTVADSYQETNTNSVFDSFTGNLIIPDAPEIQSVITGLNFTLDNGLVRRYALMDKDAISIGDGRSDVNGSLNAYFANADVSNLYERETTFIASIRTEDLVGNSYTFGWPRIKLTSDSRDVTESDVTQSLNFQALGGSAEDKKKTMYILRQPYVVDSPWVM